MANECKIEYYFKVEELKKLLKANPKAKGVIISQEITKEKPKGAVNYVNVVRIKARPDNPKAAPKKGANLKKGGEEEPPPPPPGGIDGCPYPPGCNEG